MQQHACARELMNGKVWGRSADCSCWWWYFTILYLFILNISSGQILVKWLLVEMVEALSVAISPHWVKWIGSFPTLRNPTNLMLDLAGVTEVSGECEDGAGWWRVGCKKPLANKKKTWDIRIFTTNLKWWRVRRISTICLFYCCLVPVV